MPSRGSELLEVCKDSTGFQELFRKTKFRERCDERRFRTRAIAHKFSLKEVGPPNLDKTAVLTLYAAKGTDEVAEDRAPPSVTHIACGQRYVNIQDLKKYVGIDPLDKNGNGEVWDTGTLQTCSYLFFCVISRISVSIIK